MKKISLTKQQISQIKELYINKQYSITSISKVIKITRDKVYKILKKENVKMRNNSEKSMKYFFNKDYFKKINTEEKAYWLGFISADGYIRSKRKNNNMALGIALAEKDKNHLYKFKKAINATNPIKTFKTSFNTFEVRIILTGNEICQDLIEHGVLEHKSLILQFPTEKQVSKKYIIPYIRGYFDGDGSLKRKGKDIIGYDFCLLGTKEFLIGVKKILKDNHKIVKCNKNNDSNNYQFSFGDNKQVVSMLDILYKDAKIYLDRKYKRYLELKDIVH